MLFRSLRRPAAGPRVERDFVEKARTMMPKGLVAIPGQEEFVVLVARRIDGEHVAVLGSVASDDRAIARALQGLFKSA